MCVLMEKFAIGVSLLESVGQGSAFWKVSDRGLLIQKFGTGVYLLQSVLSVR